MIKSINKNDEKRIDSILYSHETGNHRVLIYTKDHESFKLLYSLSQLQGIESLTINPPEEFSTRLNLPFPGGSIPQARNPDRSIYLLI